MPTWCRTVAGLVLALVLVPAADAAPVADPGDAVRCDANLATAPRPPVVLVHGTGVDADINWSWGYAQDLRRRGHGICLFDLPAHGYVDLQDSVPITVAAIRRAYAEGGRRRISAIGHSQGGSQLMLALRAWPDLGPLVEDVVGLAGVYSNGSEAIGAGCAAGGCTPSFWQFSPGSRLLGALADRPLPQAVDMTAIGTLRDDTVTPQPRANELVGARQIQIQDICPGRQFLPGLDHISLAIDAVAHALAIDALDHPGPADPARIDRSVCALPVFPEMDAVGFALTGPALLAALSTDDSPYFAAAEPALRCPLDTARCVVSARRLRTASGTTVRVRGRGEAVVVRLAGGGAAGRPRLLQPGAVRSLSLPRRRATLQARPTNGTTWRAVRRFR